VADKPSDIVPGTLDMLILKTVALEPIHGYGIAGPDRTDKQGHSSCQCRVAIRCFAAAAARRADPKRMETHGERQARKVLHPHGARTKEARRRNTRMGEASGGHRQNFGGVVRSYVLAA
jgi:hypothetical protein